MRLVACALVAPWWRGGGVAWRGVRATGAPGGVVRLVQACAWLRGAGVVRGALVACRRGAWRGVRPGALPGGAWPGGLVQTQKSRLGAGLVVVVVVA